jgi:hypothetical protein
MVLAIVACQQGQKPAPLAKFSKLASLELEVELPPGARIEDHSALLPDDGGFQQACVIVGATQVCVVGDNRPIQADGACAKCWQWVPRITDPKDDELPNLTYTGRETSPGGWVLEYGVPGQTFGFLLHKTLAGGMAWKCEATAHVKDDLVVPLQICRSLRATP